MIERIEQLTDSQIADLRHLYAREWWTQGRSEAQVRTLIENSDIVVAFCEAESRRLVAFARVLTDFTIKGLIFDVIVDSDFRGQGLGKTLLDTVIAHPALKSVRTFELYCRPELVPFYERWGFTDSLGDLRLMRLVRAVPHDANESHVSAIALRNDHGPRPSLSIRRAEPADLSAITEIYNEAILTTTATFDTEPKTVDERLDWFRNHDARHPVLVAILDGLVVGWASISKWSERQAYDDTAETSFYVKSEFRGRGIGRQLKEAIIAEARHLRFHTLIARVAEGSDASLHLNESSGFTRVGTMREVGRKFGRLLDVYILQKILD
ncbi:MAG TPA: GNAT family N-acetyltransferase [Pirellulales bacterium]|nr:GNAT family N-acetyltransferase [Pirellulales bacterium]